MFQRGFILAAAIATAVSMAAGAIAAIPNSHGKVIGCVVQHGDFRVIDSDAKAKCPQGTTTVRVAGRGTIGPAGARRMQASAATANVHWARVNSEGRMTAKSSEDVYAGWFDTGGYYFGASGVDLSRCAIGITLDRRHPNDAPLSPEIYDTYSSYTMFYIKRIKPNVWPLVHERVNAGFYVSASCT